MMANYSKVDRLESLAVASHPVAAGFIYFWEVGCSGTPQPARETHALPRFVFIRVD
jgi:hypothetical protein